MNFYLFIFNIQKFHDIQVNFWGWGKNDYKPKQKKGKEKEKGEKGKKGKEQKKGKENGKRRKKMVLAHTGKYAQPFGGKNHIFSPGGKNIIFFP